MKNSETESIIHGFILRGDILHIEFTKIEKGLITSPFLTNVDTLDNESPFQFNFWCSHGANTMETMDYMG